MALKRRIWRVFRTVLPDLVATKTKIEIDVESPPKSIGHSSQNVFFFSSGVIYLFGIRKTNLIQKFIYQIDCQEIFYEIFCIDTVLKIYKIAESRRTDAEEAKISG